MAANISNNSYYIHISDDVIIWTLNNKLARHSIPAILFVWGHIHTGNAGNALVLYVYHYTFKTTTSNMCIQFLAFLDIFYLCLGLPLETVDMAFPIMHGTVVTWFCPADYRGWTRRVAASMDAGCVLDMTGTLFKAIDLSFDTTFRVHHTLYIYSTYINPTCLITI